MRSSGPHPARDGDAASNLRARGMRMTTQRERVLAAVHTLGHATPDSVAELLAGDGGAPLPLSTIYRNLEALEQAGLVSHTHLDHRSSTYHLTVHANHLHLVCLGCGGVTEAALAASTSLVESLRADHGFVADIRHMAIHGWCARCAATANAEITFTEPEMS